MDHLSIDHCTYTHTKVISLMIAIAIHDVAIEYQLTCIATHNRYQVTYCNSNHSGMRFPSISTVLIQSSYPSGTWAISLQLEPSCLDQS